MSGFFFFSVYSCSLHFKIVSAKLRASIFIMLNLCIAICGKVLVVVKVPVAYSVKLQFDLHLCPVISATSTVQ